MHSHATTWLPILAGYGVLSLISFFAYAWDKKAARRGEYRIAERSLHLLDLVGGWPGGWLAQKTFRHKCSKPAFQRVYGLTVLLNVAMLAWLLFHF